MTKSKEKKLALNPKDLVFEEIIILTTIIDLL